MRTSAPSVLPSVAFALLDEARFDQDFGHLVDESDLGLWSSDLESGLDLDLAPSPYGAHTFDHVAEYGFDTSDTYLDTDDYEYCQALAY